VQPLLKPEPVSCVDLPSTGQVMMVRKFCL
jgi:hypothetical protein